MSGKRSVGLMGPRTGGRARRRDGDDLCDESCGVVGRKPSYAKHAMDRYERKGRYSYGETVFLTLPSNPEGC